MEANKLFEIAKIISYIVSAIALVCGEIQYAIYFVLSAIYLDNQIVYDEE